MQHPPADLAAACWRLQECSPHRATPSCLCGMLSDAAAATRRRFAEVPCPVFARVSTVLRPFPRKSLLHPLISLSILGASHLATRAIFMTACYRQHCRTPVALAPASAGPPAPPRTAQTLPACCPAPARSSRPARHRCSCPGLAPRTAAAPLASPSLRRCHQAAPENGRRREMRSRRRWRRPADSSCLASVEHLQLRTAAGDASGRCWGKAVCFCRLVQIW